MKDVMEEKTIANNIAISLKKTLYHGIKRTFDIFASLIGVIILLPMIIVIKIISILSGDFKTIFFKQKRIGLNGNDIYIYKFRSMVPNAEQVLVDLMKKDPKIKKEYTENKKLANDPRITKIGRFIRKYSIDEFPQFINVLIGDMSIIGPRPYLHGEIKDMGKHYNNIIKCRPGITGLWQVSGRNDVSFKYRCKLDTEYVKEKSLRLDIKIFIKTFTAVLGSKGAK